MTSTVDTLSEQEVPLLSSEPDSRHDESPADTLNHPPDDKPKPSFPQRHVFTFCLLITALVQGANFLLISPVTQLKEFAVCRSYYGPGWSLGRDCGVEQVQNGLATLIGWQQLFDCLPGILLGIFYGIIADRYGRRPVLALALTGLTVGTAWTQVVLLWPDVFTAKLTWLSSAFSLVGGGSIVGNAMIFVVASDVVSEEKRATKFFRLHAVVLVTEMIFAPLGKLLTKDHPWWLARMGLVALFMATLTVWMIFPETVERRRGGSAKPADLAEGTLLEDDDEADDPVVLNDYVLKNTIWRQSAGLVAPLQDLRFIWASRQRILLLLVCFVGPLYRSCIEFFLQYVSSRYEWRVSRADFLLTYGAVVNLALLTIILPGLSSLILRRNRDARTKDLWLARGSAVCMAVGALIIGLSPDANLMVVGLTLFALGQGFVPAVLSLVTSLAEPDHIGVLYTAVAVGEAIGMLINGPILSSSFDAGMRVGGFLMGLPFVVAGAMLAMAVTAVFAIRLPPPPMNYNDQDLLDGDAPNGCTLATGLDLS